MTPLEMANQLLLACHEGFNAPEHRDNFKKKHAREIESLPPHLYLAVMLMIEHAGWSEGRRTRR